MADGAAGYTYGDFLLQIAQARHLEEYPEDGSAPILPTNAVHLNYLKRAFRDGYKFFIGSHVDPETRKPHRWSFTSPRVSITTDPTGESGINLNGDSAYYRLPSWVSSYPLRQWVVQDQWHPGQYVANAAYDDVVAMLARTNSSSYPKYAGCALEGEAEGGPYWKLALYPRPTRVLVISNVFRVTAHELKEYGERPICPPTYDMALLACCKWFLLRQTSKDATEIAGAQAEWREALGNAIVTDREQGERRGKSWNDRSSFLGAPLSGSRAVPIRAGTVSVDGVQVYPISS